MALSDLLSPATSQPAPPATLAVVEGVEGLWSYHLAPVGTLKPLCGALRPMMPTGIPLAGWGHKAGHLPEHYCETCAQRAAAQGVALG